MGFLEGFRAAMDGENSVDFFCREYEKFSLSQPDSVEITFFQGFRVACRLAAKTARTRRDEEGSMFSRFSGEELSSATKLGVLARAIYQIEQQAEAIPRLAGSPLNLPYFVWDESKEAAAAKASRDELKAAPQRDPFLRQQLQDMGFSLEDMA
jgi:hypothetical protein